MTEWSAWWTTSGTPSGHQVTSYTQSHLSTIAEIIAAANGEEGVAPNYLNELVGTIPGTNTFRIGTGGCIGDGKAYKNDAAVDVTIPSAVGGGNTRIDRVVVRFAWSSFQGTITRIAGTDSASPTAPTYQKVSESTYDILLYQVLVDTSGNVSVQLDEREWAVAETDDVTIETNAGALRLKDGGITEAKLASAVSNQLVTGGDAHNHDGGDGATISAAAIANRTRSFFVSVEYTLRVGSATEHHRGDQVLADHIAGAPLYDTVDSETGASFIVPKDFVSNLTVEAICVTGNAGNINCSMDIVFGNYNGGENWNVHNVTIEDQIVAMSANRNKAVLSLALSDAAIDDVCSVEFNRDASLGSDTINSVVFLQGFRVTYTADS